MHRIEMMRERLTHAFAPLKLEIIDDSEKHRGHKGAEGGAGHYTVVIAADCFKGLCRVEIHRKIYQALDDLIPSEIHALQIKII